MLNQNVGYSLNASLATMDPSTFQNSPYVSSGYTIGQSTPNYSQFSGNPQQGMLNASLATMSPDTYFNSPYINQGIMQTQTQIPQQYGSNQHVNYTPNRAQFVGQPQQGMVNASLATMGPDTYLNSPYRQSGYQMGQQQPQMTQQLGQQYSNQHLNYTPNVSQFTGQTQQGMVNASLATMSPDTYLNSPYRQSGYQIGQQQPQMTQQLGQQYGNQHLNYTPNVSQFTGQAQQGMVNASLATMGPDTYLNSPYRQSGYQMGQQQPQYQTQQQTNMYTMSNYSNAPLSSKATQDPTTFENLQSFQKTE